jgi:gas vesicle protein
MKGTTKVALGIVGALAAGLAIGLLVAPEKGSKTRKRIRKTAEGWGDQFGNIISRGEDLASELKESLQNFKETAAQKIKKVKEGVS